MRTFLKQLIFDMLDTIPEEESSLKSQIKKTYQDMFYCAPEILGTIYERLLVILRNNITLYKDSTKNPPWVKKLQIVWEKGVDEMNSKHKVVKLGVEGA
tara:strand:- start:519 stop:815 length:297 start_codon:yes stop_codon:yes gene_type:complete